MIITDNFLTRAGDACVKLARYERWEDVRHFEAWEVGNATAMNLAFMARLDFYREVGNRAVTVNAAYATAGHSHDKSFHYLGMAADIVLVQSTLEEMFLLAVLCGFRGIGIYPYWKRPGIHIDIRPLEHIATWMRNREREYVALPDIFKELLTAGREKVA